MLEDREGAVWIGTSFSGLFRHDDSGFEAIQTTHQEILSLAEDREGNLWVGTAGGGVNRVRRRAVALEGLEAGLPFAAVQSICEDAAGNIWAATQEGAVARRTGGRWTALPLGKDWPGDATCVAADRRGPCGLEPGSMAFTVGAAGGSFRGATRRNRVADAAHAAGQPGG